MVMETAFRSEERFTQKQFWRWVEGLSWRERTKRWELLDGRIVMSPPAKWRHSGVSVTLTALLHQHVQARRLGIVFDSNGGFDLPSGDTVAPDVSFVTTARFRATPPPKDHEKAFLHAVPSLVVEVLSPSTCKRDRTEKAQIYARCGVEEYWIVDPDLRTVSVRTLEGDRYAEGPSIVRGRIRSSVLPKLRITIDDVFADVEAVEPGSHASRDRAQTRRSRPAQ
jgi:Uma2 family endonuclease